MPAAFIGFRKLTPDTVLAALCECIGEAHGVTARELVRAVRGFCDRGDERRLRLVIEALRTAGHGVCGHPAHGYYMAQNAADLDRTCEFLYARAMTSLRQVAALKRVAMPDLRGQLGLSALNGEPS